MDWTEHHSYDEMSTLTSLSLSGKCSKETADIINKHCDALFMEMYEEGVDCEGWEPHPAHDYRRQW